MASNGISWFLDLNTSGFSKSIQGAQKQLTGLATTNLAPLASSISTVEKRMQGLASKTGGKLAGAAAVGLKELVAPLAAIAGSVLGVSAVMAGVKSALDLGGEMTDLSNRTGIAVENLMGLRRAFKDAGVDANNLGPAVNKMQKALASAVSGGKEADVLASMGLDPQSLASIDPGQAFAQIGNAISQLPNATERAAASMALFGKSGAELLQVFMDPNFKEAGNVSETAKILGENAGAFDKISDSFGHIGNKIQGLFVGIASGIVGPLEQIGDFIDSLDLSSIGKKIGDAITTAIMIFKNGDFGTLVSNSLMIGLKEALNFLLSGIVAIFKTIPDAFALIGKQILTFFSPLVSTDFWSGIKDVFLSIANSFAGQLMAELAVLFNAMRNIPGIGAGLGKAADFLKEKSDARFAAADAANGGGIGQAISEAADRSAKNQNDFLDAFIKNVETSQKVMGGTDAERAAIADVITRAKALADSTNAAARADNANRVNQNGAYNPDAIGMGAEQEKEKQKAMLVADSLAKIGGGGVSVGGGNAILDETKRQTGLQQQMVQQLTKLASAKEPVAQFAA